MELVTMIMTLSLIFGLTLFFITKKDWKLLLSVVPIVFLIPFTLQLDSDQKITFDVTNLGCWQTSNTTGTCQYFAGTHAYPLDPSLMTTFTYLMFLGILMLIGYIASEAMALRHP